jgi:restriction system protein
MRAGAGLFAISRYANGVALYSAFGRHRSNLTSARLTNSNRRSNRATWAQVAELVDALASGASGLTAVKVRVLSWAPLCPLRTMFYSAMSVAEEHGMGDDKTIWGIHMPRSLELRPVEAGYVAIGWSGLGNLKSINANREAFKAAVSAEYPDFKMGAVPIHAGTLFKFIHEIKAGDLIVYPSKPDRMVNLGKVVGDYFFDASSDADYPNRRRVNWISSIPRAEFSQSALHEIGSAVTLFQIKNNAEEFLSAFEGQPFATEAIDEETVEATSAATEDITEDFVIKRLKSKLDPYQFEAFVAHLLERMGYHARVTQKSGDGGVDVIAHKDELGFEPPIIKVQCKQTLNTVGQPEVAQLYGHVEASREHGLFITLGEYSAQARQFERSKHNLRLLSGEELVALIFNHYDRFEPRYQMLLPLKRAFVPGTVAEPI